MGQRRKLSIVIDAEFNGGRDITAAADAIERTGIEADIASERQDKFNKKQKELAAEVSRGTKKIDEATEELKQYGDELERGVSKGDKAKAMFSGIGKGVAVAGVAFAGAAIAAKQAYEIIGEGAELEAARGKFDNLSASINTTGDALLGKLQTATKGMISDAELVAGATTIMNLGLAKTEAGTVRMAAAVGALNLDLGVMALTLANNSTARLDALGLSMENVAKTKQDLINSGFIGDAFDEAVLIELEKKMTLLGDASLTTAGKLQIVESQWKNVTDEMKKNAAVGAGPVVGYLSDVVTNAKILDEALAKGVLTQQDFAIANSLLGSGLKVEDEIMRDVIQGLRELDNGMTDAEATTIAYYQGISLVSGALDSTNESVLSAGAGYETYTNAMIGAGLQQENFNASQEAGRAALAASVSSLSELTGFMSGLDGTAKTTADSMNALAVATIEQGLAAQVAAGNLTPLQAAISSINTQEGMGLVTSSQADQLRDAATEFGNLTTVIGDFNTGSGVTVEQGQLIAEKIALIGTTSISTEDEMRLMAVNGSERALTLGGDFSTLSQEVLAAQTEVFNLNNRLFGLPEEKKIKIIVEYETRGNPPAGVGGVGSGGQGGGTPAQSTGLNDYGGA